MYLERTESDREHHYSLSQILQQVQGVLEYNFPDQYWIVAEVGQIQRNRHCYLTLTETNSQGLAAQVRATIWNYQLRMLADFEEQTGQILQAGMKVLLCAKVSFHVAYGLSLQILELDAGFTLGELALRRKRILDQLQREGLLGLNKLRPIPALCQRIAVISSSTAAGFEDFVNQLSHNPYGFRTYVKLFPAVMQGAEAEKSVRRSLLRIAACHQQFDVVVIIRGGGSSLDLECFNSYGIARAIAELPLPVLSGIGHQRDQTITDLASHGTHKTPTAVAEFLLMQLNQQATGIEDLAQMVTVLASDMLETKRQRLLQLQQGFERISQKKLHHCHTELNRLSAGFRSVGHQYTARLREQILVKQLHLNYAIKNHLSKAQNCLTAFTLVVAKTPQRVLPVRMVQLQQLEQLVQAYDPKVLLMRGYSITFSNGQVVKDQAQLEPGALLYTELANGGIVSQVVSNKKQHAGKKVKTQKAARPNGNQLLFDL